MTTRWVPKMLPDGTWKCRIVGRGYEQEEAEKERRRKEDERARGRFLRKRAADESVSVPEQFRVPALMDA